MKLIQYFALCAILIFVCVIPASANCADGQVPITTKCLIDTPIDTTETKVNDEKETFAFIFDWIKLIF